MSIHVRASDASRCRPSGLSRIAPYFFSIANLSAGGKCGSASISPGRRTLSWSPFRFLRLWRRSGPILSGLFLCRSAFARSPPFWYDHITTCGIRLRKSSWKLQVVVFLFF